ncbi:MAG: 3-phosphoserine/phosphohydroxythreonine transaminase [Bacteroidetes bacterium]|nr:3-phosphoserine/phosphohydroxythreonine transaminase [Bacteroidota bacterium]
MMYNFNAGPSALPKEVTDEAAKAIINFNGSGLSILEIGHRTPLFEEVMNEARSLVKELMDLDAHHEVLFLHGGATTQFMQIPMNLLEEDETVAIADTGVWSGKAIDEASCFGKVAIACSSKDKNYNYIPDTIEPVVGAKYFHLTTNNTIFGTQWKNIPQVNVPLVADMSSDIFSRQMDFNSFDLIYAGVQKNAGAAGATLAVINKNILGKIKRRIPPIMDYAKHIEAKSMLNTPPVFAILVSMLTLRWLKTNGGVAAMEKLNNEKSRMLYDYLDSSALFKGTVRKDDRSNMNVCFVTEDNLMEKRFLEFAKQNNIYGIKGHRLSGGFRVSLYNATPLSSVQYLIEQMKNFENSI